jgi:phosphoglycolate phosphatase
MKLLSERLKLVFDLDGTLIDSSFGIIEVIRKVLEKENIIPACKISSSFIGPPLRTTLSKLSGIKNEVLLDKLLQNFKDEYDSSGYKLSEAYPGISEMLYRFKQLGIEIHIATNKRLIPTNKILDYLGWNLMFKSVFAIDCKVPPYENKTMMLEDLVKTNKLNIQNMVYIGDTKDDAIAAASCGMKFILAKWGYGDFSGKDVPEVLLSAKSSDELTEFIILYVS